MSFTAMLSKETSDLLREKRFGGWALTFLSFWSLFLLFALVEFGQSYNREYPQGVLSLGEPTYFFYAISFAVLALFQLSDGVTKERESGMLPVVGAKPIVRWHVPLAKLAVGFVVYLGTFIVSLLPLSVLAYTMGFPVIEMMVRLYLGPFLALYVFLVGLGLLLSVAFNASKIAIGTAAGLLLPLFFMMQDGPMSLLYRSYPTAGKIAAYTPFEATHLGVQVVVYGGQMPWLALLTTAALGLGCGGVAFWLFSRQEVAA